MYDFDAYLLFFAPYVLIGVGIWMLLSRRPLAALMVGALLLLGATVSLWALNRANLPFTKLAYTMSAAIILEIIVGLLGTIYGARWLYEDGGD